jgi:predicted sulfurtransferase
MSGKEFVRNTKTLLAFLAVSTTIAALWLTNGAVTPKKATWDDVLAEAKNGAYRLISTDDLWKQYSVNRDSLLLVDTRQEWEYRTGHIQGAVNFPMEPTWFARWKKKGDLRKFLGADKDRTIVFY